MVGNANWLKSPGFYPKPDFFPKPYRDPSGGRCRRYDCRFAPRNPAMDESRFTTWKYRHPGPGYQTPARRWWAGGLLLASLPALTLPPLAVILFVAAVLVFFTRPRKLLVSPRYLICGERIVYFANVVRVERDDSAGQLRLTSADNSSVHIERDKFASKARKADKIRRNQAAKFVKVADHLVEHVRKAAPDAAITVAR